MFVRPLVVIDESQQVCTGGLVERVSPRNPGTAIVLTATVAGALVPSLVGYLKLHASQDRQREQIAADAGLMGRFADSAQAYIDSACPALLQGRRE